MSRLTNLALALSAGSIALIGLQAAPAHAATSPTPRSAIVGQLGYEGGAATSKFHPTAGTVEVEFNSVPLVIEHHVGKSGKFHFKLSPGSYTLIGCGPAASSSASGQCSQPQNIKLVAGEVDHIRLIWARVP
jgi:hypothetical protein